MKQTLHQLAQKVDAGVPLSGGERRAVLQWFGQSSVYFPTEEETQRAQSALLWLDRQRGEISSSTFAQACSLPEDAAAQILGRWTAQADRPQPVIIGIEGLDGSGKTVQAERLRAALCKTGKTVLVLDFPQYSSFFGKEIGALLSGKDGATAMELDGKSMCLWYAIDRWDTIHKLPLERYDYVIFNRYVLSNAVYQTARGCGGYDRAFLEWVFALEHTRLELPVPDVYLYFDTQASVTGENVLKKGQRGYVEGLDVYERSQDLLTRCHGLYRRLAAEIEEVQVVPCMDADGTLRSIEDIHEQALAALNERGLL
ncbi:MAG: hypothetical protein LUG44_00285 [Clostridiales bacterium]|nr:hypothetical protein [Clostridiales bacterium]